MNDKTTEVRFMQLHNLDKILEAIITLQLSIDHNDIVSSLQKDQFLSRDVEKHVIHMSTKKINTITKLSCPYYCEHSFNYTRRLLQFHKSITDINLGILFCNAT